MEVIYKLLPKKVQFDCPPFQHHFKDIKSPFATSVEKGKDQDNQAWAGTCCNYGKVGWTYIWQKSGLLYFFHLHYRYGISL